MLRKTKVLAAFGLALTFTGLAFAAPALAETTQAELKDVHWSFDNPVFGKFDQEQLQRGYKVYHDVCANCHSMNLMTFGDMAGKGGPFYNEKYPNPNDNPYVKALAAEYKVADVDHDTGDAIERPATTADHFKAPFANEYAARAANGGALPPDMSLLAKAREGGPAYIYSLVTSYQANPPAGLTVAPGKYYNPMFPGDLSSAWKGDPKAVPKGGLIGMPPPLRDGAVTYDDGFKATTDQEAKDVAAFLAWAAEPHADDRRQAGFSVVIYLLIFAGLLYASYKRIWRNIAH
jgi:ubiquinol-cytochrome c reductase cytochrome c1 subunit